MDDILKILLDEKMQLPMRRNNRDYLAQLKELLFLYHQRLVDSSLDAIVLDSAKRNIDDIIEIVSLYYNGYIGKSYEKFSFLMRRISELLKIDQKLYYDDNFIPLNELFRVRVVDEYREYSREDIFHIPFNLRTRTGSSRYSIAGYPCLYLSTTLSLCHYESEGAKVSFKIFSKFRVKRAGIEDVYILDLALKPVDFVNRVKEYGEDYSMTDIKNYLKVFPLILAVSFIKPNSNQQFVPEYIVSQFCLQWIREKKVNEKTLCGIRYFSSKGLANSIRGFNYVFPTVFNLDENDEKFCSVLSKCVELTEPIFTSNNDGDFKKLSTIEMRFNNMLYSKVKL